MTNEEIIKLLRELSEKADAAGEVKSRKVRINFSQPEEPAPEQNTDDNSDLTDMEDISPEREGEERKRARTEKNGPGFFGKLRGRIRKKEEKQDESEELSSKEPEQIEDVSGELEEILDESAAPEKAPSPEDTSASEDMTVFMDTEEFSLDEKELEHTVKRIKRRRESKETPVEAPDFEKDADDFREINLAPKHRSALWEKLLQAISNKARGKAAEDEKLPEKEHSSEDGEPAEEASPSGEENPVEEKELPEGDSLSEEGPGLRDVLRAVGIGRRELAFICGGLILLLLVIVLIANMLSERHKRRNVVTEEGLRVSVEREPSKWCTESEVTLLIRTESPIQSITVNGDPVSFTGENSARIHYQAMSDTSEIMVVTQEKVMNASVEFPRIDADDPRIKVSSDGGKITLEAEDERSGIDKVWYGLIDGFSDVPAYTLYEEPFKPEEGKNYSYYAVDKAGNVSVPVVTNLTPATGLLLKREQISLFPGETSQMQLEVTPDKAFVNDLTWTSSDPQIASVDEQGIVTALADGSAVIEVSAEGLNAVSCVVNVNSEVSLTVSAVGDITLGEDISFSPLNNFTAVYTMNGPSWFFDNVRSVFSNDDITFANFEGTLTDQGTRENKQYAFRGDPSYANILKDGSVDAVTLANNHSQDYGAVSLTDTEKYLDEAGIDWCNGDKIILKDVNGIRAALIGIYVLADGEAKSKQVEETIAAAKEEGAQIIIVAFHWGNEKENKPDSTQQILGRLAIDSGADLVVGHHPHVLQGIEKYAGKYICYSLGNFCFGGNSNPSDMDTIIFQQTFHVKRGGEIDSGEVKIIPCSISSVDTWNNYQPTPATGEEAERILARVNELSEPFKTSF